MNRLILNKIIFIVSLILVYPFVYATLHQLVSRVQNDPEMPPRWNDTANDQHDAAIESLNRQEYQDFGPDAGDFNDSPPIFDEEPPVTQKHLCGDMDMKIPFVLSIGALDVVNFGPEDTILLQFPDRKFFEHTNLMGVSGLDSPGKAL
ncbi:Tm-1 protein [Striga asiatica]|uniref:Tm-1 protein n=1 Tax=Striga asiatica TaxID=4170 RepID=A0A5A7Q2C9_STRAF|nr:Tm-1 protein [Striga asiatica]